MLRNSPEYKVRYRTDKIPHSICRAAPHGRCCPASALRCSLAFWGCDGRLACKAFYYFRRSRSELDADSARYYPGRDGPFVVVTPVRAPQLDLIWIDLAKCNFIS